MNSSRVFAKANAAAAALAFACTPQSFDPGITAAVDLAKDPKKLDISRHPKCQTLSRKPS